MWVVGLAIRDILPFHTWLDTLRTLNSILFFLMFWFHLVQGARLPERWEWFEKLPWWKQHQQSDGQNMSEKKEAAAIDILKS